MYGKKQAPAFTHYQNDLELNDHRPFFFAGTEKGGGHELGCGCL